MQQVLKDQRAPRGFKSMLPKNLNDDCVDLIERLLTLDPKKRISAKDALKHEYFVNEPKSCEPSELPNFEGEITQGNAQK